MIELAPQIVVITGMHAAGKTTNARALVRRISNSTYLDRDAVSWGMLHIALTDSPHLPPVEQCIGDDLEFEQDTEKVSTFIGIMRKFWKRGALFDRHIDKQSYLVMANLARQNVLLGKVIIIDSFLACHVMDGTLAHFLAEFRKDGHCARLVHFVAEENECWKRHGDRSKTHTLEEQAFRIELSASRDSFDRVMPYAHHHVPNELAELLPFVVDTSHQTIDGCSDLVVSHLSR